MNHDTQRIADLCRFELKGYRDGEPGTVADIEARLAEYEKNIRQLHVTTRHLLKKIEKLEEKA